MFKANDLKAKVATNLEDTISHSKGKRENWKRGPTCYHRGGT